MAYFGQLLIKSPKSSTCSPKTGCIRDPENPEISMGDPENPEFCIFFRFGPWKPWNLPFYHIDYFSNCRNENDLLGHDPENLKNPEKWLKLGKWDPENPKIEMKIFVYTLIKVGYLQLSLLGIFYLSWSVVDSTFPSPKAV